jgi:ubiquinone/menaquinone biosynthesis C-methylase UbiE
MLTANYDRLGLRSGEKILDLGCGFGRHAFEAARRGADVIALDAGRDEVNGVAAMFEAMLEAGEIEAGTLHTAAVQGDALHLPFPDATFDRVICSEVLEHIPDDVAAYPDSVPSSSTGPSPTSTTTCPVVTSESIDAQFCNSVFARRA